ncbi:MAG: murein biosynthesis integral membrane protein MurJ [Peptococcaceae bacterium]|nr:murein biosynthesis integral membrane protein MurJ [Peptococcaceae bacterium]
MSTSQKMFRAAGFIMVANLLSRVLGLFRNIIMAYHFGPSLETDAYVAAFNLPDFLFWVLAGGTINAALIPVLTEYADDSRQEERWRIVSSVTNFTLGAMCVLILISILLAPYLMEVLLPADLAKQKLATRLTRLLLLQPIFMALAGISMGILNMKKIFWPSAMGTLLYNICVIICGLFLSPLIGIHAFVIGVLLGAVTNFAIQIPHLKKVGLRYRLVAEWHPAVRRIFILALPILVFQAINYLQTFMYTRLAGGLETGAITAMDYAYRLNMTVVGVFAIAVGVASFPSLAEQVAHGQRRKFVNTLSESVRMVIFVCVPASVGMILLRTPLLSTLFQRGEFTASHTEDVAIPLIFFAIGITAQGLIQIIPRAYYALQSTWQPVLIGSATMVLNVVLMFIFIQIFPHPYKTGGLALALTLGALVQVGALFFFLRRKIGPLDGVTILVSTSLTLLATTVMAVGINMWQYGVHLMFPGTVPKIASVIELFGGIGVGFLIFIFVAKALCAEEYRLLMETVRRRKN